MTEADLGLADAYINGDFSFVDQEQGLLNLFLVRKLGIKFLIQNQQTFFKMYLRRIFLLYSFS